MTTFVLGLLLGGAALLFAGGGVGLVGKRREVSTGEYLLAGSAIASATDRYVKPSVVVIVRGLFTLGALLFAIGAIGLSAGSLLAAGW